MVGRLAPGVTTSAAQAALDTWAARLEREYPGSNAGRVYHLEPLSRSRVPPYARGTVTTVSAVLAAAALAVLIIACLDVAGLFGVRASRRAREAAIRSAIGAPRSAIVRQLLVESLVLSALGALGALAVTALLASVAGRLPFPLPIEPRIDPRVLGFTFAVAGACGVLIGLLPALRIARRDLTPLTRRADRPATARLRGGLIVTQVALSLGLVLIASLLLRTVVELQDVPIGFDSGSLVVADVGPATAGDAATYSRIVEGVLAAPGVDGVSVTGRMPGDSGGDGLGMRPEGAGEETRSLSVATVGDGFFETLGVPILAGRDLGAGDAAGAPIAVVVNRSLAERFWSVETAVGRRIELVGTPFSLTVAGVADDVRVGALRSSVEPMVFGSYRQSPVVPTSLRLVARTGLAPEALAPVIREAVAAAGGWSGEISTLEERVRGSVAAERAMSISLWSLGLTALLLAAVGLYGLLAFAVGERRHEIGVRMALGADGARVRRMVVGRGLALTLAGVALGLLAGVSAADAIEGLLYGVGSLDPVSLTGSCLLLVAVAVAASWVPAARAARLDPVTVLRRE
jgi:predicted permease